MIEHKLKIKILQALIDSEILKQKTSWGRELKLLKQLGDGKYDDAGFWLNLKPGYMLHSFAFFKTERGATEIEQAWRLYKMDKEVNKTLDTENKPDSINLNNPQIVAPLPAKKTALNWADS